MGTAGAPICASGSAGMESCHISPIFPYGWRFLITVFGSSNSQWFALFMVLQCVWTITRATLSTAVVAVIAEVRIAKDEKALDEVYNQCLSMEMERKLSFEQRESRKEEPVDPDKPPPEPPDILDAFENQRYISKLIQWSQWKLLSTNEVGRIWFDRDNDPEG
jgi:hypothetical protein